MKILINGFSTEVTIDFVPNLTAELNPEKCFWITEFWNSSYQSDKIKILDRVAHSNMLDNQGYKNEEALSSSLIESMYECEVVFLKMIERIEMFKGHISYDERKRSYYNQLKFWDNFIKKEKITCFISSNIPHETYDFIIYSLCKLYNIPTYSFFQIETDFVLLCTDIKKISQAPNLAIKEHHLISKNYSREDFSPRAQRVYDKYVGKANSVPFYMNKKFRKLEIATNRAIYFKRVLNKKRKPLGLFNKSTLRQIYFKLIEKRINIIKSKLLDRQYEKIAVAPDLTKPYIYVPLHYQPELTTSPIAEVFVDQHLIINILSATVPENIQLYIKEHPAQKIYGRSSKYYTDILAYKNTVLVSKTFSSKQLISNSLAIATATGTAGWEALFKEKPVLLFGNSYYAGAKGTFQIKNEKGCKKALEEIISDKKTHTVNDTLAYLKALDLTAIIGNSDAYYQSQSIYQDKNPTIEHLIASLLEKMNLSNLVNS